MSNTKISICSSALQMLGAAPIASFDDAGDRARLSAILYPSNRNAVLRAHTWNCLVKRVVLSPLIDGPLYGWRARYVLPSDWRRTIKVGSPGDYATDYKQEGRYLLANDSQVLLRYVSASEDDEGAYDDLLIDVLTHRMAWVLAYPVTKSTSLRDSMAQAYSTILKQAKSVDSMEEPTDDIAEDSPLILARS